mgnify:CR=1 FL=1
MDKIYVRAALKPIPTLARPLGSVDLLTKDAQWLSVSTPAFCEKSETFLETFL